MRTTLLFLLLLLAGCPVAGDRPIDADDDDAAGDDDDADDDDIADDDDATGADVLADVSGAICDGLLGCCSADDHDLYFAAPASNELLASFVDQVPPITPLDASSCPSLVADMFTITPFGDWLDAVASGAVQLDEAGYASCLDALQTASCGAEMRAALFDGTCFGFAAPGGGEDQRASFVRTGAEGASCTAIRDGFGAGFYGTCDPTQAFCCFDDGSGTCAMPFDGDGAARSGTCATASTEGEACGWLGDVQLCATGLECVGDVCAAPLTAPLAVGQDCVDSGFQLLGECVDSWCDLFGSRQCEPFRDLGAACFGGEECSSGLCDAGSCVPNTICGD